MKAIQIRSHGGLEVLQSATLPDPTPKAGEVLVRVRASALNPLDSVVRKGHFPIAAKTAAHPWRGSFRPDRERRCGLLGRPG
jgi:NADPH:quinone reductase-like Zn-dependent oxidoreductase